MKNLILVISIFFISFRVVVAEIDSQKIDDPNSPTPPFGWYPLHYDFTGDDFRSDMALFKDGIWRIRDSLTHQIRTERYGIAGDIPVPEYYFNHYPNGKCTIAVWRPSNGTWHIKDLPNPIQFGLGTDKPVPWDYDWDQISDIAVFRNGIWYILRSYDNSISVKNWGQAGDIPIPGFFRFYTGYTDLAVYRPSNSTWYILDGEDNSQRAYHFGTSNDQIVPADYDGDRVTDIAVFRSENGIGYWYIRRSSDESFRTVQFGLGTDIPVPAFYETYSVTNTAVNIAVYRESNFTWYYLSNDGETIGDVAFGSPGEMPVPNNLYR